MNWIKRILFLRRHIKKGDAVIQVGFSLDRLYSDVFPISWIVGKEGKLIIIEPDPRSYFKLQKRKWMMKSNYTYDNRLVNNLGWPYINLTLEIKHNNKYHGAFILKSDMCKLDNFNTPDIIILTCNGAEYDCLESGLNMLSRGVKFIVANANMDIENLFLLNSYSLDFEQVGKQKLLIARKDEKETKIS